MRKSTTAFLSSSRASPSSKLCNLVGGLRHTCMLTGHWDHQMSLWVLLLAVILKFRAFTSEADSISVLKQSMDDIPSKYFNSLLMKWLLSSSIYIGINEKKKASATSVMMSWCSPNLHWVCSVMSRNERKKKCERTFMVNEYHRYLLKLQALLWKSSGSNFLLYIRMLLLSNQERFIMIFAWWHICVITVKERCFTWH